MRTPRTPSIWRESNPHGATCHLAARQPRSVKARLTAGNPETKFSDQTKRHYNPRDAPPIHKWHAQKSYAARWSRLHANHPAATQQSLCSETINLKSQYRAYIHKFSWPSHHVSCRRSKASFHNAHYTNFIRITCARNTTPCGRRKLLTRMGGTQELISMVLLPSRRLCSSS